MIRTQEEARARLRDAIDQSGLSLREFARVRLVRSYRTVERWLAGTQPIPQAVLDMLEGK